MQGGEFGRPEAGFLLHEMRLHQIAVRDERLGERQADDAFREAGFHMHELVVHENQFRRRRFEAGGAGDQVVRPANRSFPEGGEVELLDAGEAPGLIAAFRRGSGEKALPSGLLTGGEPGG